MLEDLLRNLERRVIQFLKDKGKEVAKKVWAKVRPVIATIKQTIQMLKEMALRLKENIETVINGVYNDLQKTFGEVYNTIKAELDNAAKDIEAKVKEIENSVKDIADVVERNALDVINDVKGGINDIGKEFSAIDKELKNIEVQAARAIAKVFALLNSQHELNRLVEPAYNETLKVELEKYGSDAEAVFKEVKLNLWAVGVKASVVNFVNPKSWEQRLAVALTDMQKCMKEDINKIGALMSKEGARQLLTEHGMTMRNLKKELDINDYVNIVYSSVSDVVIPNPKAYYSSLRAIVEDAAVTLKEKMKDEAKEFDAIIRRFVNAVWRNIRREILEPIINHLKKLLLEIVRKQIVNKLLNLVNNAVKNLADRFPALNNVSKTLRDIEKELKERGLTLDDLKSPQKLHEHAKQEVRMLVSQGIDKA